MLYRLTQICWNAFFFLWELPQNLMGIGAGIYFLLRGSIQSIAYDRARLFIETPHSGVSLGYFIFWCRENGAQALITRQHEYGHSIQSRLLGPLYLLIIGIPSYTRFLYGLAYRRAQGTPWPSYYKAFPENWADRLGKVRRSC